MKFLIALLTLSTDVHAADLSSDFKGPLGLQAAPLDAVSVSICKP